MTPNGTDSQSHATGAQTSAQPTGDLASQSALVARLRAAVGGRVIAPSDADYDEARKVIDIGFDRRPAAIVQVATATDVEQVIAIARETGVELAVRGGGHSVAGHSASEGGIVVALSAMKGIDVDVAKRTAWAEAGVTAQEYTETVGAYGLATGFGDTGSVGIAGITLSGGIGFLVRKYGMAIDDLLAAEIVTADGETLHTDAATHPDLFWAIRGGGGNFGVLTRLQFRLHELANIVGGMLILPATPEVLSALVAAADAAPEELSAIFTVVTAPPVPFIPAEYHGRPIIMVQLLYAGDADAGQGVIAPFRTIVTPIADMVRPMPYAQWYRIEPPRMTAIWAIRTMFLDAFKQREAEVTLEHVTSSKALMALTQIRVLGGAMARVPVEATAFAHRKQPIMAYALALYANPAEQEMHEAWAADFAAALAQGKPGAYVGFLGDEGAARVHEAYPGATWERLAAIKARYDPTNLFRMNQNIPPAPVS